MFSICPPTRPDGRSLIHHGLLTLLRPTIGTNRSRKRKFWQICLVLGTNWNNNTTTLDTLLSWEHLWTNNRLYVQETKTSTWSTKSYTIFSAQKGCPKLSIEKIWRGRVCIESTPILDFMIIITIITIITTIIILNEIIISVFIEVCIEPTPILAFSGWNIASISLKADCKSPSLRLKQGKHIHLDLLTLNFSETFLEFCALLYKITREGCFQQSPSKDSSRAFVSSKSFSSRNATSCMFWIWKPTLTKIKRT